LHAADGKRAGDRPRDQNRNGRSAAFSHRQRPRIASFQLGGDDRAVDEETEGYLRVAEGDRRGIRRWDEGFRVAARRSAR